MNAQNRSLIVSALLVISLTSSTFADVLVLKDGTLVDGDVDSLLRGSSKSIQTPDGRSVSLGGAIATHLGVSAEELKGDKERSSFTSDDVTIRLKDAYIFERVNKETTERFLQVNVEVANRDERRYLNIVSRRGLFSNNYELRLKDDVANEVRKSSIWNDPHGDRKQLRNLDRVEPEKPADGAILFEPPLPKTEYLVLDLAPQMFEINERIAFMGAAFLLIPFDSVSTPESRLLAATEAVERYGRTADDADSSVAKKLLNELAGFGEKEAVKLNALWKLVPFEHMVMHLESTSESMPPIDWSKIDSLRVASEQASEEEVRDSLLGLCRRAALAIVKHGEATLETNVDSALQDYWIARLLSVDSNAKTKTPATPDSESTIPRFSRLRTPTPKTGKFGGDEQFRPDSNPKKKTSLLSRDERLRQELTLRMKTPLPSLEGSAEIDVLIGSSERSAAPSLRSPLSGLRQRTALALTKRGEATLETNLDSALQDYWSARLLIVEEEFASEFRGVLANELVKRFGKRFSQGEFSEALADYASLRELSPQSSDDVVVNLGKVPPNVLFNLPANVLSQLPQSSWPTENNSIGMKFKFIPGGTFTMGDGNVAHQVTLTRSFAIGVFEVTQEQFEQVMGTNPSTFVGAKNPVENVSWGEAVKFCEKLSELPSEKSAGYVYRLPTEAEWEYACRAGTKTAYSFGDDGAKLREYAWCAANSDRMTHPVGGKKPNPWGLYDVHGNVMEWCSDRADAYPNGAVTDPTGARTSDGKAVARGGHLILSQHAHSAARFFPKPTSRMNDLGFRVLRLIPRAFPEATSKPPTKHGGTSFSDIKASGFIFSMPEIGKVVSSGSFTIWTVPAAPEPRKDYMIVIRIKLLENTKLYRISDLSGKIVGADFYVQGIPFDPNRVDLGARSEVDGQIVKLRPSSQLQIIKNHVQIMIPVKGGDNLVRDTIHVKSRILNENQKLEIEF